MGSTSPPIPGGPTAASPTATVAATGNMRVFMDDDEESCFELDIGTMGSSSPPPGVVDFRFHISLSPLPTAGDLFSDGLIIPLQPLDTPPLAPPPQSILAAGEPSNTQSSLSRRFGFRGGRGSSSSRSHDEAAAKARSTGRSRAPSRTTAVVTATAGVLKFLVKFPSEKIRTAFLALATRSRTGTRLKPLIAPRDEHRPSPPEQQERRQLRRALLVPLRRLFIARKRPHGCPDERPRVVDVGSDHSGFMKALAEAMHVKGAERRKGGLYGWQRPVSAPSSLQSSPRHSWSASAEGEEAAEKRRKKKTTATTTTKVRREGSITSAIAHCKGVDTN